MLKDKNPAFSETSLFDQMTNISKANAYDILVDQVKELQETGRKLLERANKAEELNRELIEALQKLSYRVAMSEIGFCQENINAKAILAKANSINQ